MDILKIRKKAQQAKGPEPERQASAVQQADAPAADPPPAATPAAAAPVELASSPVSVEQEPSPVGAPAAPPAAAAAVAPAAPSLLPEEGLVTSAASAEELAAKFARTRRELREDDPLGYFLAYYDAELEDLDDDDKPAVVSESSLRRFLAFDLAHEAYAVSILDVREILKTYAVTQVPRAPRSVLGVLSKRGVVMPVIDLAAALGLREPDPRMRSEQRILVVGDGDEVVGLRVDRVHAVVRIPSDTVEAVPGGLGARSAHLLSGLGRVGEQLYILLDVTAFLGHLHGSIEPDVVSAGGAP
jgi:purine-binding chemotaxis protein CheW